MRAVVRDVFRLLELDRPRAAERPVERRAVLPVLRLLVERAEGRRAPVLFRAVVRLAPVLFRAVVRLAPVLFRAVLRRAPVLFRAVFRAVDLRAVPLEGDAPS